MKKLLFMLALMISAITSNAQTAIETSKLLDNTSVGITVGATTPLDMNSVFPLNTNVGIVLQKDLTPLFGVQLEGLAILNDNHFADMKTFVKATNVGVNGTINWSNALWGYKGKPRSFEFSTVTGLGWAHMWNTSVNYLTSKVGVDLAFNLGEEKTSSIVLTPYVAFNLSKTQCIEFNKNYAQLGLSVTYKFNHKKRFKLYDIGELNGRLAELELVNQNMALAVPQVVEKVVVKEVTNVVEVDNMWVVQFAQNSDDLTDDAIEILNTIKTTVDVVGTASPEGSPEYNQGLSERRAKKVADYLEGRGIKVNKCQGKGVVGNASNRLVIVKTAQ